MNGNDYAVLFTGSVMKTNGLDSNNEYVKSFDHPNVNMLAWVAYEITDSKGPIAWCEDLIALNRVSSTMYAQTVLRGRFEKGEESIATGAITSINYAFLLNDRFELGEPSLMKHFNHGINYLAHLRDIGLDHVADQLENRLHGDEL